MEITRERTAFKIDLITWLYSDRLHVGAIEKSAPINSMLGDLALRSCRSYAKADFSAASADYLRRLEAIFGQAGWVIRKDGGEAVLDNEQILSVFNADKRPDKDYRLRQHAERLLSRAAAIDIPALLASHLDDQFVVTPKGGIYTPIEWDELFRKMDDPKITSILPCSSDHTHQRVADRYADVYQRLHSKPWGPYEKSWMDN